MNASQMDVTLKRLALQLIEKENRLKDFVFVGIRSRGDIIMKRLAAIIAQSADIEIPMGALDITFYRDDLSRRAELPEVKQTDIAFDITDKRIMLIDDVFYTGRTVRAAMDALFAYGRPALIRLLVLLDRDNHELPLSPDYVGMRPAVNPGDIVNVKLDETDGVDAVYIETK
ncbi:MAG: bifunctional pyr operon transcriptional regulator/uracil phosphoribosyltransferase PyrR [Spirochaetes bacterium]|nr:bifunctional pyr operon transcriptional regulator/uracil phosphoribosyltransferase PyrR [Spirochaetota bacterium]